MKHKVFVACVFFKGEKDIYGNTICEISEQWNTEKGLEAIYDELEREFPKYDDFAILNIIPLEGEMNNEDSD